MSSENSDMEEEQEEEHEEELQEDSDDSDDSSYDILSQEDYDDRIDQIFIYNSDQNTGPQDEEKIHGKYYIGTQLHLLFDISVSPTTFFHFTFRDIIEYMREYSMWYQEQEAKIEIMKLVVNNNTYNVILKTHWIRLIQRKWKNVLARRNIVLNKRKAIHCQMHFQIRYMNVFNYIPTIHGMLYEI